MENLIVEKVVEDIQETSEPQTWIFLYHYSDQEKGDLRDVNFRYYRVKDKEEAYHKFISEYGHDILKLIVKHFSDNQNVKAIYSLWNKLKQHEKDDNDHLKKFLSKNFDLLVHFLDKYCDHPVLMIKKLD